MSSRFKKYTLEGSHASVGLQHGSVLRPQIERSVQLYQRVFYEKAGLRWPTVLELAGQYAQEIQTSAPGLFAEMEGIAKGSGLETAEIVALNCRTDLLRASSKDGASVEEDGCTAMACLPEATAKGRTYLAQNWDVYRACLETTVVLEIRCSGSPTILILTEAGVLSRSGLNEFGIGVTGNSLESGDDADGRAGIPVSVSRRMALNASNFKAAVSELTKSSRSHSNNHLIGSDLGVAQNLELTPSQHFTLHPSRGLLTHANHFVHPNAVESVFDIGVQTSRSSVQRGNQLDIAMRSRMAYGITLEDIERSLEDHEGYPDSICRHATGTSDLVSMTVASTVMELDTRMLRVAKGTPCNTSYSSFALAS